MYSSASTSIQWQYTYNQITSMYTSTKSHPHITHYISHIPLKRSQPLLGRLYQARQCWQLTDPNSTLIELVPSVCVCLAFNSDAQHTYHTSHVLSPFLSVHHYLVHIHNIVSGVEWEIVWGGCQMGVWWDEGVRDRIVCMRGSGVGLGNAWGWLVQSISV